MIRLLSTDFDGTLVEHFASPPVSPELFDILSELKRNRVLWAVNTGRALAHIVEGLEEFAFPVQPDFVVTTEREIFRAGIGGWEDFGDWNRLCQEAHDDLYVTAGQVMEKILKYVEEAGSAEVVREGGRPVGLVAASERDMKDIVEFIDETRQCLPAFSYQQNTVYLRFCHAGYSKGSALAELGRLTGIPREATCAIGDHLNDIPMLDGRHALLTGCPSNAAERVKQTVQASGGIVAKSVCSAGVVEIIRHFWRKPSRASAFKEIALSD